VRWPLRPCPCMRRTGASLRSRRAEPHRHPAVGRWMVCRRIFGRHCAPAVCVAAVCRLGAMRRVRAETADGRHGRWQERRNGG
jgi:hypothetical protein